MVGRDDPIAPDAPSSRADAIAGASSAQDIAKLASAMPDPSVWSCDGDTVHHGLTLSDTGIMTDGVSGSSVRR